MRTAKGASSTKVGCTEPVNAESVQVEEAAKFGAVAGSRDVPEPEGAQSESLTDPEAGDVEPRGKLGETASAKDGLNTERGQA
jgi:hypothetical protein